MTPRVLFSRRKFRARSPIFKHEQWVVPEAVDATRCRANNARKIPARGGNLIALWRRDRKRTHEARGSLLHGNAFERCKEFQIVRVVALLPRVANARIARAKNAWRAAECVNFESRVICERNATTVLGVPVRLEKRVGLKCCACLLRFVDAHGQCRKRCAGYSERTKNCSDLFDLMRI